MRSGSLFPAMTVLLAVTLTACGSGKSDDAGSEGAGGSGSDVCNTDTTRLASHAAVSLRTDVMPIFSLSCVAGSCHDRDTHKAGLFLGNKITSTTPLVDADATAVHGNIVSVAAKTVTSAIVMRVAPVDPDHSFLLQKTAGTHTMQGYTCSPQDTSVPDPCGDGMPPRGDALCTQSNGQQHWDTLAAWVLQGAKDN